MINSKQYEFLKERLKDAKQENPRCTAYVPFGVEGPCSICPLLETASCPCEGQGSVDEITELMKEYEEANMNIDGIEITKEDYEFLKRQKQDHELDHQYCTGGVCDYCVLDKFETQNMLAPGSCCPGRKQFMTAYTALTKQYEKENGIKKENKMKNENETAEKHNESGNETETYYDRLQRYYKKDFRMGDRVFVKPQEDCRESEMFTPRNGKFGEIIIVGDCEVADDEQYFYELGRHGNEYSSNWALPVVSPEDAYRAMLDGRQVTSKEGYSIARKEGGIHYDAVTKCFVAPDDENDNEPLSDVDFIILDKGISITKQEIADKFGINVKDLIIED